jgi:hypothetical protein
MAALAANTSVKTGIQEFILIHLAKAGRKQ